MSQLAGIVKCPKGHPTAVDEPRLTGDIRIECSDCTFRGFIGDFTISVDYREVPQ